MMKKNKLTIVVLVAILVLALCLNACGGSGDALKGTWGGKSNDGMEVTWTFDGKGKCTMKNEYGLDDEGTYTIDGSAVVISLSKWDGSIDYTFEISGSTLKLTPDEDYRPSYELEKK